MLNCNRFSWISNRQARGPINEVDVDLYHLPEIGVTPSLGGFVPGWLLLVPRETALSVATLNRSQRARVMQILNDQMLLVGAEFAKPVTFFEHGAVVANSSIGCGVEQAHLHVCPTAVDLVNVCQSKFASENWFEVSLTDPWHQIDVGRPYYLVGNETKAIASYPNEKVSQFFRRVLARELGRGNEWDYRSHPHFGNAAQTIYRLSGQLGKNEAA